MPTVIPAARAVIARKYRLIRTLGEGGMGLVFEAENLALGKRVAVKWMRSELETSADLLLFHKGDEQVLVVEWKR